MAHGCCDDSSRFRFVHGCEKMHRSSSADLWWSVNGGFELTVMRNLDVVEILVRWWREEICTSEDYGEALL